MIGIHLNRAEKGMERLVVALPDALHYHLNGNRLHIQSFVLQIVRGGRIGCGNAGETYGVSLTWAWHPKEVRIMSLEAKQVGNTLKVSEVMIPVCFKAHKNDRTVEIRVEQTNISVPWALAGYGIWHGSATLVHREVGGKGIGANKTIEKVKRHDKEGERMRTRLLDKMMDETRNMLIKSA